MPLTALSLAAAILMSGIALYLAGGKRFTRGGWLAGSLLAGIGACAMHYTGMTAATMVCISAAPAAPYAVGDGNMGLAVFNTASVALIFILSRIEIDDWLDIVRAKERSAARQDR